MNSGSEQDGDGGDAVAGRMGADPTGAFPSRGLIGLRFADAAVEGQFRAAYAVKTLAAMRFAVLAGIGMYALFGLLDGFVVSGAELVHLRTVRFGLALPLLIVTAVLLRLPIGRSHGVFVASFGVVVAGLGIILISLASTPQSALVLYPGLLLVQVFSYTLMQLPFAAATLVSWFITLLFNSLALARGFDPPTLISHNFFLVAGNCAGMVGAWFLERLRRRDFAAQLVLSQDRTQLAELARELERIAQRDPLTGLLNRRQLDERLRHALHMHQRYGVETSLILADLDGFKDVNDTYGHPTGDALLVACAGALKRCTRAADQVFRYGGDEFLVVAPETPADVAVHIAARIQEALLNLNVVGAGHGLKLSCSIGVGCAHGGDAHPADLLGRVDAALYTAKRDGKARTVVAPLPSP